MPHIIIEHDIVTGPSGPLDVAALADALHASAAGMDALPTGGLRTRAHCADISRVGDGAPANAFCYVTVRLGHGRSDALRREIGKALFDVLSDWAEPAFKAERPLSLGLEVQEIAPGFTFKRNNIHDLLEGSLP